MRKATLAVLCFLAMSVTASASSGQDCVDAAAFAFLNAHGGNSDAGPLVSAIYAACESPIDSSDLLAGIQSAKNRYDSMQASAAQTEAQVDQILHPCTAIDERPECPCGWDNFTPRCSVGQTCDGTCVGYPDDGPYYAITCWTENVAGNRWNPQVIDCRTGF